VIDAVVVTGSLPRIHQFANGKTPQCHRMNLVAVSLQRDHRVMSMIAGQRSVPPISRRDNVWCRPMHMVIIDALGCRREKTLTARPFGPLQNQKDLDAVWEIMHILTTDVQWVELKIIVTESAVAGGYPRPILQIASGNRHQQRHHLQDAATCMRPRTQWADGMIDASTSTKNRIVPDPQICTDNRDANGQWLLMAMTVRTSGRPRQRHLDAVNQIRNKLMKDVLDHRRNGNVTRWAVVIGSREMKLIALGCHRLTHHQDQVAVPSAPLRMSTVHGWRRALIIGMRKTVSLQLTERVWNDVRGHRPPKMWTVPSCGQQKDQQIPGGPQQSRHNKTYYLDLELIAIWQKQWTLECHCRLHCWCWLPLSQCTRCINGSLQEKTRNMKAINHWATKRALSARTMVIIQYQPNFVGLILWNVARADSVPLTLNTGRNGDNYLSLVFFCMMYFSPLFWSDPAMLWCNEPSALHFMCMIMWRAAAAIIRELFAIICRICNGIIMSRTDRLLYSHFVFFCGISSARVHGICVYLCAWCIWPIDSWVFEFSLCFVMQMYCIMLILFHASFVVCPSPLNSIQITSHI